MELIKHVSAVVNKGSLIWCGTKVTPKIFRQLKETHQLQLTDKPLGYVIYPWARIQITYVLIERENQLFRYKHQGAQLERYDYPNMTDEDCKKLCGLTKNQHQAWYNFQSKITKNLHQIFL